MSTIKLDKTAFPLYAIVPLNSELFVAAGGGGAAKTGIKNAIVSFDLYNIPLNNVFVLTLKVGDLHHNFFQTCDIRNIARECWKDVGNCRKRSEIVGKT